MTALRNAFALLSSLKLTLVCLAAAIVLIFAGTIAQVHLGIHEAQQRYFQSLLVWWPPEGGVRIPIFPGGTGSLRSCGCTSGSSAGPSGADRRSRR